MLGAENVGEKDLKYRDTIPQVELLIEHIRALKRIRNCESARIVFAPESNLSWSAALQDYIIQSRVGASLDICTLHEDKHGRPGIPTTNELKGLMVDNFKEMLKQKKVKFYRGFISVAGKPDKLKVKIVDQLRDYNIYFDDGDLNNKRNKNKKAKQTYGGKSGKGSDDMAIATQLNPQANIIFYARDRYELYR